MGPPKSCNESNDHILSVLNSLMQSRKDGGRTIYGPFWRQWHLVYVHRCSYLVTSIANPSHAHLRHSYRTRVVIWTVLGMAWPCTMVQLCPNVYLAKFLMISIHINVIIQGAFRCLTKAYDVTIPIYRKSQRKIAVSKIHILHCISKCPFLGCCSQN